MGRDLFHITKSKSDNLIIIDNLLYKQKLVVATVTYNICRFKYA